MPADLRVVDVGAGEVPVAAAVLGRAFESDPLARFLFPKRSVHPDLAPLLFAAVVRYHCMFGRADRLVSFGGVALWLAPGQLETAEGLRQAGFDRLSEQIGRPAVERMGLVDVAIEEARRRAVPEPHWYLRLLGVEPSQQSGGLGGALLQHGLARADGSGAPCYLETFREQTIGFYLRHGFELLTDDVETTSGIHYWGLIRRPGD